MTHEEMLKMFPNCKFRTATISVTLFHDEIESDESLCNAIEQELLCCHCIDSIDKIEITE